jgi:shikimate dehydrogenase
LEITSRTRVVGVFADPVEHTLSPPMQNAAFAQMGLPYAYVPWHVKAANLPAAVEAVRALSLAGVNVTIPHKVAVMDLLDEITPVARLIGAVNTIENRHGYLVGHNTDAPGFLRSLTEEAGVEPASKHVLILGAGGAARAIAVQMVLSGAKQVTVANRTNEKAAELCQHLAAVANTEVSSKRSVRLATAQLDQDTPDFQAAVAAADILINTTAVGMYPKHEVPPLAPASLMRPEQLVCDIVYTPQRTTLLMAAQQAGCRTLAGLGMLAYQGAIAIEIWTGQKAPVEVMKAALVAALKQRFPDQEPGKLAL